jgi:hypothetical protein
MRRTTSEIEALTGLAPASLDRRSAQEYCWDWINARFRWETTAVFHTLMDRIEPKIAVEKSPALANREEFLERVLTSFPKARFLHITPGHLRIDV